MAIPRKPKSTSGTAITMPATDPIEAVSLPADPPIIDTPVADIQSAIEAAAEPMAAPAVIAAPRMETFAAESQASFKHAAEKTAADMKGFQEQLRAAAEQSLAQSRAAYEKAKAVAEDATTSLETSYAAASRGLTELNQKAIGAIKAHADMTFDHVKAVLSAKSVSEVVSLQGEHMRKQFDVVNAHVKDLTSVAQRVAVDTTEPLKTTLTKRFAA